MVLGVTHTAVGLVVGTILVLIYNNHWLVFFALLGALFPDIDIPTSMLGRYVKPIGRLAKHRGFYHSLFAAAFLTGLLHALLLFLGVTSALYATAFLLGYLSHLFFDAITKEGIQPFYPSKQKIRGKTKVGSLQEWFFTVLLTAALVWFWARPV